MNVAAKQEIRSIRTKVQNCKILPRAIPNCSQNQIAAKQQQKAQICNGYHSFAVGTSISNTGLHSCGGLADRVHLPDHENSLEVLVFNVQSKQSNEAFGQFFKLSSILYFPQVQLSWDDSIRGIVRPVGELPGGSSPADEWRKAGHRSAGRAREAEQAIATEHYGQASAVLAGRSGVYARHDHAPCSSSGDDGPDRLAYTE